jgi:hypothetical protein
MSQLPLRIVPAFGEDSIKSMVEDPDSDAVRTIATVVMYKLVSIGQHCIDQVDISVRFSKTMTCARVV